MSERELPEGVIDAAPPGGWQGGDHADGVTQERNAAATGSPDLTESGTPENAPQGAGEATPASARPEQDAVTPDDADPDLRSDQDVDDEEAE